MSEESQKIAREAAANQRKDYVRALEEERDAVKAAGKTERAAEIAKELKRVKGLSDRDVPPSQIAAPNVAGKVTQNAEDPVVTDPNLSRDAAENPAPVGGPAVKPLAKQTIEELKATADARGVDLGDATVKDDIRAVLETALGEGA